MKKSIETLIAATLLGVATFVSCASSKPVAEKSAREILVVSFGTSFAETREADIGGIERAIEKAFPNYKVERAFTADTIIRKLEKRDGLKINSLDEAFSAARENGITDLVVQPTHLMNGFEFDELCAALDSYKADFKTVRIGNPLLSSDEDFAEVATAIAKNTEQYIDGKTAVCLMGHGTEATSNSVYAKMQDTFVSLGFNDYFVGTVEATPTAQDIIAELSARGSYSRVVLLPLMVVAGDHAHNDMAGMEDDTIRTMFADAGYEVDCVLDGLGQIEAIQDVYVERVQAVIDQF